jgi:hypothetical protein
LRSDRGRVGWIILLPTALLMLASAGLATFLILWLTVIRGIPGSDGLSASIASSKAFTVNEGTTVSPDGEAQARLLGLTISTITVDFLTSSQGLDFLISLVDFSCLCQCSFPNFPSSLLLCSYMDCAAGGNEGHTHKPTYVITVSFTIAQAFEFILHG